MRLRLWSVVDRPHVNVHYERDFPYPVDVAYAWLTDYQDDDHARAGAIIKRRIVIRKELDEKGRPIEFELEGELETLGQKTGAGRAIVHLFPDERRWVAQLAQGRWVYEYRLVPTAKGSRILIDYRLGSKRWQRRFVLTLSKPLIRREIDRMWDGFATAMGKEIGTGAAT
jgi:hypothetical protein